MIIVNRRPLPYVFQQCRTKSIPLLGSSICLPFILGFSWSISTVFLFAFGPFRYYISNTDVLYLYLVLAHFAIWFGYQLGIRRGYRVSKWNGNIGRFIFLCLVITLLKWILDYTMGVKTLAISTALSDPTLARELENQRNADYIGIFLSPFSYSAIPLTVYYWSKTHRFTRLMFYVLILLTVADSISTATRSGILAMLTYTSVPLMLKVSIKNLTIGQIRTALIGCVIIMLFIFYSTFITESRESKVPYDLRISERTDSTFNFEHPLYHLLPETVRSGVLESIYYYTHGYFWLAKSLDKPFIGSALGAGHSRFLMRNVVRIFDDPSLLQFSYFFRLNSENGMLLTKWITIYPWIASDTTFPGSVLILFFFGWLIAQSWLDTKKGNDPYSVVFFTLLVFQLISMPQGAITQDGPLVFTFYTMLILWLRNRSPRLRRDRVNKKVMNDS